MISEEQKKFENDIDSYMSNKNIFRNRLSYLIQGILIKFEKRFDDVSRKITAETEIHHELDILDTSLKLTFQHCSDSCRKDSNLLKKLDKYFEDVKTYNHIRDYYILSCNGKAEFLKKENRVQFNYNQTFFAVEALNLYNKLNRNQNNNKNLSESLNFRKGDEGPPKDVYKYLRHSYFRKVREFDNTIEFKNYSLEDFYDVYLSIYTYVLLNRQLNQYNNEYNPLYIDCEKTFEKINTLTNIPVEKIRIIVKDLTFNPGQKLDLICTPLIEILDINNKKSYITSYGLFLYSNIERNAFVLLDNKYKISDKSFKEKSLNNELVEMLKSYKNISYKFNIKIPKENSNENLTDIDMVLYDSESNSIIVSELKNFLRADTIAEHLNVQGRKNEEGLNKGFSQISKIKDYYYSNPNELLKKYFGFKDIPDNLTICFTVISKNNLGSRIYEDIKILDTINFENLLKRHKGKLLNLIQEINSDALLPKLNDDYWCEEQVVDFAGYKITYPFLKLKHKHFV
ncbi:hypothetical protein B1748_10855 [Paenibacillus sp. MY03]|uniref:hypothetical protein n=1 Tax=Paenibacillus sp. MY03 TaxID=302980 RepID=UPI000B3D0C74|nr:hypothetical protein [Paenibacillus sp. MY03]OUS76591.1 hypothetical protein B1748_10855 [Paenibacillus sp. MY03]